MPGGLLQLVANGQANIILNGNPTTTFFKSVYKQYTPFGLQRFRLDYDGLRNLSFDSPTEFNFKIKRYAEMLWDTYIVVNMPDIWSPLYDISGCLSKKYEFQWIKKLGFNMINQITIYSGGCTLAQYSGEWMQNAVERDDNAKKNLMNKMIGNVSEMNNPKKMHGGKYPNSFTHLDDDGNVVSPEPSIKGRKLYIPLLSWFCSSTKTALPLIALQYQEIEIKIEFRPVKELFTILNDKSERTSPNSSDMANQMWRFLQEPPLIDDITKIADIKNASKKTNMELTDLYTNRRNDWNTDIHLIGTYIFLGDEERRVMATQEHNILIKSQYEWDYFNTTGSKRIEIPSRDMISSYMWRFRRSDVNERNEWSNYQNYDFEDVHDITLHDIEDCTDSGIFFTPKRDSKYIKNIMTDMAILCGQDYRESTMDEGIYKYIEKFNRTSGIPKDGLYCYNFCTGSNRNTYQPTGAQNTNKWKYVIFELNTIEPPRNPDGTNNIEVLCEPSGSIIGIRKNDFKLNKYNFDLRVFEERYNIIQIIGGKIGLLCAR